MIGLSLFSKDVWNSRKGEPSIILFGPTPVNRVYQTKINRVLKSSSKVDHYNLDKDDFSIKEIQVNDIVEIAKELI